MALSKVYTFTILRLGIAILFLVTQTRISDGFSWITKPHDPTYAFIGTNATIRWHFNLSITERLDRITMKRSGTTGLEGMIKVSADGRKTIYMGYRDHVDVRGLKDISLFVFNVTVKDEAQRYCCVVEFDQSGGAGEIHWCIQFKVVDPPVITSSPSNLTANVSDIICLECAATGRPDPQTTWHHVSDPSTVLSRSGRFNLTVSGTQDGGEYWCTANNSFGQPASASFYITVQYKPSIVSSPQSLNISEGNGFTLYCNATGYPIPEIRWTNPKSEIIGYEAKLTLNTTQRDDAGEYTCIAVNLLGSDQSKATIDIHYPPDIVHPPDDIQILTNETDNLQIYCNATGNPIPIVIIRRAGEYQDLGASYGSVVYYALNISRYEAGKYVCIASNVYGNDTQTIAVTVQYKPRIITASHGLAVIEGNALVVHCDVSGLPAPTIQWTKDGITLSNTSSLDKPKIRRTEAGEYFCIATNLLGCDKKTVVVDVHYPPEIIWIEKKVILNETENRNIYCNATGNPQPNITWAPSVKHERNLQPNIKQASIVIGRNNRTDAGLYKCIAANYLASVVEEARVVIQYKPDNTNLIVSVLDGIAVANETLVLKCVTQAVPTAKRYEFFLNGNLVTDSHNSTRGIHRVTSADEGTHACVPYNVLGQGEKAETYVIVHERAVINKAPRDKTVNEGGSVTLECGASGIPVPNVTWSREGDTTTLGDAGNMTLFNVTRHQAGTYRCTATNGVGASVSAVAVVAVNFAPEITTLSKQVATSAARAANLTCDVTGFPLPMVTWSRNGTQRSTQQSATRMRSTLEVVPRHPGDFGEYTCTASNLMGWRHTSITLTRVERPGVPTELTVIASEDSLTIHWRPPFVDGGYEILGYKVDVRRKEGSGHLFTCPYVMNQTDMTSCTVSGLESDTIYTVTIAARNRFGFGRAAQEHAKTRREVEPTGSAEESTALLSTESIIGIGTGAGLLIVLAIAIAFFVTRRRASEQVDLGLENMNNSGPPKILNIYENPPTELNGNTNRRIADKQEVVTAYGVHAL